MAGIVNSTVDTRLPLQPETNNPELYAQLSLVYNAIRQLQLNIEAFLDIPPKPITDPYTLLYIDRGISLDTNSPITIPLDGDPAFSIGTVIVVTNVGGAPITITPDAGVTLVLAGIATTGPRTLSVFGVCTLRYLGSNTWIITGAGLT
jgi:hypothetical protein